MKLSHLPSPWSLATNSQRQDPLPSLIPSSIGPQWVHYNMPPSQSQTAALLSINYASSCLNHWMHTGLQLREYSVTSRELFYVVFTSNLSRQLQSPSHPSWCWLGVWLWWQKIHFWSMFFLGNNLISWWAKKQPVESKTNTEVEYRSLALATTEMLWLQSLLTELGIPFTNLQWIVITSLLYIWPITQFFTSEPNTWNQICSSSKKRSFRSNSMYSWSLVPLSVQILWPSPCHLQSLKNFVPS